MHFMVKYYQFLKMLNVENIVNILMFLHPLLSHFIMIICCQVKQRKAKNQFTSIHLQKTTFHF